MPLVVIDASTGTVLKPDHLYVVYVSDDLNEQLLDCDLFATAHARESGVRLPAREIWDDSP